MKKHIIKPIFTLVAGLASLLSTNIYAAPPSCTGGANCWQTIKPAELDSRWVNARCNDGTPASYEYRPSPTGSKDWVVLLEGGGACDDLTISCKSRSLSLTTTSPLANRSWHIGDHHGLLSPDNAINPEFYNANLVHIDYCSSDFWGGATLVRKSTSATPNCAAGDANCGWFFSGRYISRSSVQSLMYATNFRDDGTHKIMFIGSSAGGFGLASAAESLSLLLPNTRAADRLRFVFDGSYMPHGWTKPLPTLTTGETISIQALAAKNREFWGSRNETFCERDYKLQGMDPSMCMFASIYYPYLTSTSNGLGLKVFLQNSTQDKSAISRLNLTDTVDLERWRCLMTSSLQNANWLFSSGSAYHTLIGSDTGIWAGPTNNKLWQVVGQFYRGEPARRVMYNNLTNCGAY